MSKQIDERVVEMTFDNSNFEKNVSTSMSTIDKLKKALNFKGAEKGLNNINSAAKKVDFKGMSSAVDAVKVKFDALQVAGTTALVNITNAALNTGKQMISAFTIEPITQGFAEYETQLNAVQTIMANTASKGTTIEQVTDALNELNTYADKTIYNFTEMTRNIGTFTAAGVDLDKSVASIKGIANLAAMSGSSSSQAATAMYQLSQAIAAGRVSLMDWNSVVNAGMGGEQFQEALKRTARIMGTGVDAAIEKYGSFRESLTQGQWLTTDVLTETLKQISGAYSEAELMQQGYSEEQSKAIVQMATTAEEAATKVKTFTQLMDTMKEAVGSGWAQTWQTIFGDFYEARDFWTSISDFLGEIVGQTSDARNNLLEGAFDSNWDQLRSKIEDAGGSWDEFQEKVKQTARDHGIAVDEMIDSETTLFDLIQNGTISTGIVGEAFGKFIDDLAGTVGATDEATQSLQNFHDVVNQVIMGDFGNGQARVEALTKAGYDYATIQDLVNKTLSGQEVNYENLSDAQLENLGYTEEQIAAIRDLQAQAKETGSSVNELIENLTRPSGRELFFSSITNILKAIIEPAKAVREAFHNIFGVESEDIYNFLSAFEHFTGSLVLTEESADKVRRAFEGVFAVISIITSTIGGTFGAAFTVIQTILDELDIGFLDFLANLGDSAVAFADFIKSVNPVTALLQFVASGIASAIKPMTQFGLTFENAGFIPNMIKTIIEALSGLRDNAIEFGSGAIDIVSDFINNLLNLDDITFDNIIQVFKNFGESVKTYFSENFTGIFDPIVNAASTVADALSEEFGWVIDIFVQLKDVVVEVVSTIIDNFSGTGLAGLFAIVFGAGVLSIIAKFLDTITSLASPMEALSDLFDNLSVSFAKFVKAKSFQAMSVGVRNIAIAVGILAASVFMLAQVPTDQLIPAAGAIVAISVALAGVTAALGYFAKGDASIKLGASIAAIGAGVLMIASAFAVLNGIDTDSLIQSGTAIVAIMGALTGLSIAMQKFGGKGTAQEFGGPALQIVALAAAVRIVADAVKQMSGIDQGSMTSAIFGMITVFGALTALMAVMNKFSGGLSNASSLLVMAIGLQAFLLVINNLANFDASGIVANLPNIIVLFGMITALMAASSLAGANSVKGGAALILISGAMLIMTQVISIIGNMDEGVISRAMSSIIGIGFIFTMLIAVTSLAGDNAVKAGASLLIMSTAIIVLTGAIALLGSMDESTLAKGTAVVAAISAIFAGLIAVTHFAGDASKTIIKLTIAIGALVAMVALLSFLDPAKVVPATACITALMVAFGAMAALTKFSGKATSGMIVALGVIGVLSGIVALLGGLPMDGAIQASISIGILMTSMSAALVAMGYAGDVSPTAMAAMGILTGVVALLAVIMGALTALDVAPSIETAASISVLLLGMTAVLAALSVIGPIANLAMMALGPLIAVIGTLGAVFAALGALNNLLDGGVSDAIAGAIPIMENIGTAIGSFVGGIVGGFASGAMSSLPSIGASISSFWMNIQPFVVGMQVMGPDALTGVKTLVEMLTMITGANLLESLGQFFGAGNSMDQFAVNLQKFGEAISVFSTTLSEGNFNGETVTAAANAGKALAEMQSMMQGEGGIFTMFEGVKDMGAFGEQIKAFGEAMVEFSEVVDGNISESAVTAAANAGKTFAELQKAIGPTGGNSVLEFFSGTKDLGDFGAQIKAFGEAMVDFSNTVDEGAINEEAVTQAKNAGEIMAALEDSIDTTSGGVVGFFAGETNLESFGAQIKAFGEAMVEFSNALTDNGGVDTEAITKAKEAGAAMSDLANSLPTYAFGSGKLDLTGFGNDLTDYAGSLSRMASTLESVDLSKISQASGIASKVSDILVSLQGVDESVINKFWVLDTLATSLSNFSNNIGEINTEKISLAIGAAQRVAQLIQSLSGITGESVSGFANAVSQLGSVTYDQIYASFSSMDFSLIGVNVMTRLAQGIQVGAQNVQAQLNIVLSSLGNYTTQESETFYMGGLRLATELATGIQNGAAGVSSAVTSVMSSAVSALSGYESQFYSAGSNLALGFANGISSSAFAASTAAAAMASAAATAARNVLDIHSPSRVMEEIGEYTGAGFTLGLEEYVKPSEKIGEAMANAVARGTSTIADLMDTTGTMTVIAESFRELSEAMDKTKKDEKESAEEAVEENSKLVDVLSTMADKIDDVVSRKNDLKSIGELLARTGVTFTEGFVDEMINSSGQFAGAITDMVELTDEQLQNMVDAFTESEIIEQVNELTDSIDDTDGSSLIEAIEAAGIEIIDFIKDINKFGFTLEDVSSSVESFAESVADGFSSLGGSDMISLDEFTDNIEGNLKAALTWQQDVSTVFGQLNKFGGAYTEAIDYFRKQVLEGGYSKWGKIMHDLAYGDQQSLVEFTQLINYVYERAKEIGLDVTTNVTDSKPEFVNAGSSIAEGIAQGITEGTGNVTNAVTLMCDSIKGTVTSYFGIHSPSKLMAKLGSYIIRGLNSGILSEGSSIKNTLRDVGDTIFNFISSCGDIEYTPTITPVLDANEIRNKMNLLNSYMSGSYLNNGLSRIEYLSSVSIGQNGLVGEIENLKYSVNNLTNKLDGLEADNFGVKYTQNNYSPKALDSGTIYRQTKNQISLAKKKRNR